MIYFSFSYIQFIIHQHSKDSIEPRFLLPCHMFERARFPRPRSRRIPTCSVRCWSLEPIPMWHRDCVGCGPLGCGVTTVFFFLRTSWNGYPEPLNDEKHETMKSMNQLKRLDDTFWFIFVFCEMMWLLLGVWNLTLCLSKVREVSWLLVIDTVQFEDDLFLKWVHKRWV